MVNVAEPPLAVPGATLILEDNARIIADNLLKLFIKQGLAVNYFRFYNSQADLGKPIQRIDDNEIKFELTNGYFEIILPNGEVIHITSSLKVAEALTFPTPQKTALPHTSSPELTYHTIALDWYLEASTFNYQTTSAFAAKLLHLYRPLKLVLISQEQDKQYESILKSYVDTFGKYFHVEENKEVSIILRHKNSFFIENLNGPIKPSTSHARASSHNPPEQR